MIDRCNLTILLEPGQEDLAAFLADNEVEVVASLPCYLEDNVDRQRGKGVFDKSIVALRRLNGAGYGDPRTGRVLNLVFNPQGPNLPPNQEALQADYKRILFERHGIVFNELFALANMPIQRFGSTLISKEQFDDYMALLEGAHRPENLDGVMCRTLVSVDYEGFLHDCDFNQMLKLPLGGAGRAHLRDLLDRGSRGPAASASPAIASAARPGRDRAAAAPSRRPPSDAALDRRAGPRRGRDDRRRISMPWRRCAPRGAEVIVVDGGSARRHASTRARRGADRVLAARARPGQPDERRRRGRHGRRPPVPARRHAAAAARPTGSSARRSPPGARVGPLRRAHRRAATRSSASSPALMNRRSRLTGIATGDQAIFVTREAFARRRRLSRHPADGGHRAVARGSSACRARPASTARVTTSGRRWERERRAAHDPDHVAPAPRLLPRRRPARARASPTATVRAMRDGAVAVLAKAPIPGYAKTRLIPLLGPEGAARLQGRLIERALATAVAAGIGPVTLWCAPDAEHPFFQRAPGARGVALAAQPDGDLGARMLAAFEAARPARRSS